MAVTVIDATRDRDGCLNVRVRFPKFTMVEQVAIIPKQQTCLDGINENQSAELKQLKERIAAMSDEEYTDFQLGDLKERCEAEATLELTEREKLKTLFGKEL